MFNCPAVKKRKQLVTWFLSYRPKCISDTERKFWENAMFLYGLQKEVPKRIRGIYTAALNQIETTLKRLKYKCKRALMSPYN